MASAPSYSQNKFKTPDLLFKYLAPLEGVTYVHFNSADLNEYTFAGKEDLCIAEYEAFDFYNCSDETRNQIHTSLKKTLNSKNILIEIKEGSDHVIIANIKQAKGINEFMVYERSKGILIRAKSHENAGTLLASIDKLVALMQRSTFVPPIITNDDGEDLQDIKVESIDNSEESE